MEKKIIFCNIAWMKEYLGARDNDRPMNGGEYVEFQGTGGEAYNFLDHNGICHGFVRVGGAMALEKHFKESRSTDSYIDDILVIWVATNKNKETRIVGWYKNARVYRTDKDLTFFTDPATSSYYNITAKAKDCYLVPENNRDFSIDRASEVGTGKGIGQSNLWYAESNYAKANIIPKVIEYVNEYDGTYANFVYDLWNIEDEIAKIDFKDNFEKLYEEGEKSFKEKNDFNAMVYFKAAEKIDRPVKLIKKLAILAYYFLRLDESIELFNEIIEKEGETVESLIFLRCCYDLKQDREKMIEYAFKLIEFNSDSLEDLEHKRVAYINIFDAYLYDKKFKKAEKIIDELENFLTNIAKYSEKDIDDSIKPLRELLNYRIESLVK